jgi:protein-S-isoprenylcysteine O-methyltransferase Ste14
MKKWKTYILSYIWGPILIAQIVLVLIFGLVQEPGLSILKYVGYVVWVISMIFGWLPILVLKRKGSVAKGKSYVHTTTLVKSGIYGIIRHPQYTAGQLFSLALILVSQNWLIIMMGVIVILLLYIDILNADKHEIEKFGDDYIRYMKEVPRVNFLLGIIRLIRRKLSSH